MIEIRASRVHFYSQMDEDAFIDWLEKISSISKMYGEVDDIVLVFISVQIKDEDLLELISLHSRYKINKKHLEIFLTTENMAWFHDKNMYWYNEIFEHI